MGQKVVVDEPWYTHSPAAKWRENCCFLKPFSCLTDYFFEFVKSLFTKIYLFVLPSSWKNCCVPETIFQQALLRYYAFCQVFLRVLRIWSNIWKNVRRQCISVPLYCLLLFLLLPFLCLLLICGFTIANGTQPTLRCRILTKNVLLPRVKTSTTGPKSVTVNPFVKASDLVKHTLLPAYFKGTVLWWPKCSFLVSCRFPKSLTH